MGNMPGPDPEPPLVDLLQIAMEIPEVSRLPLRDDYEEVGARSPNLELSDATGLQRTLGAFGALWCSLEARLRRRLTTLFST